MAPMLPHQGRMPPSSTTQKPTVLVVDDDEAWRTALKDLLEREGFKVVPVARTEWTFPAIDLYRPAAVVIDNQMPGAVAGIELLSPMRARWPELLIVMMTAFGGRLTADEALRRGASVYFDKPFRVADLVGEIRRHLGKAS
jgi:DNA-binding NtrC family response regulator